MDTIKLQISEDKPKDNQKSINTINVTIFLNDESMSSLVDITSLLGAYTVEKADFNLYTCSCGIPECGGFFELVKHEKDKNTITWTLPEEEIYTFSKKTFVFDKKLFQKEVNQFIDSVLEYEKKGIYLEQHLNETCPSYLYEDNKDEEKIKEEQLKILKKSNFLHIIKKSKKYYLIQQKFNNTISKNFIDYLDKKIYIKYANKQSDVEYNFGSLICRLLNEFPRVSVKNEYYFQVQQAGFELIKFFNKEDNSIKEILENNYQNNGLKSNSFLPYDFFIDQDDSEDKDFNLDLNLLEFKII